MNNHKKRIERQVSDGKFQPRDGSRSVEIAPKRDEVANDAPSTGGGGPSGGKPTYLRHNERIKLTATWLNTIAAGMFTVGIVAPIAGLLYGVGPTASSIWELAQGAVVWFICGIVLHFAARGVLGRLRE